MQRSAPMQLLVFGIAGQQFALQLAGVERVVRAAALTPLPRAPSSIRGALNLHGRIIAVADLRRRLGFPERDLWPEDRIVIARSPRRTLGVLAEGSVDIVSVPVEDVVRAEAVAAGGDQSIVGIVPLESGLVLIHDLGRFLSLDEERALDEAMNAC